ncbi:MAG TPA: GTP 3',8-cyclase MoaA [Lautropia sp.]|jgi:cyclic pyranopterin phosphate synthase|nr:GTP 3',8-cyclase MoaA [Lautropia sp.]
MSERIIPIADSRYHARMPAIPATTAAPVGLLSDARGRRLHDLRISVTDRCNFRCTYCMPKSVFDKNYAFLPQTSLLSFEEITRLTRLFVAHGVEKLRLTGGEPLLRKHLETLVAQLAEIKTHAGKPLDLTLTTNASLLRRKAAVLKAAGLNRVTVSLDALDDDVFRRMNDVDFSVAEVLAGIEEADRVGFRQIKINMVVKRGVNHDQIVGMARHFKGSGHIVRFIEFMDVGASNGWRMDDVVPSSEVIGLLDEAFGVEPVDPNYVGEVAERWRYRDGSGEVGVISSVSQPFCSDCSRARLSTEGRLYTCLFATSGHDFRSLLRGGFSDEQISAAVASIWTARADRYSEVRASHTAPRRRIEMSYIGG